MPKYLFPNEFYPTYVSGACYVMRLTVANTLFRKSWHVPLIPIEDAYVTGLVRQQTKIEPTESFYFYIWPLNNICGSRGAIYECLDELENLPKMMRGIFNQSITCPLLK